jgi:hypothetical protein
MAHAPDGVATPGPGGCLWVGLSWIGVRGGADLEWVAAIGALHWVMPMA